MPNKIRTGLDNLLQQDQLPDLLGERTGYVGHEASVTQDLVPGYLALHQKIKSRLQCLFGPQHGFHSLDQDNMVETRHQMHPLLQIPVYSLYSETRKPTAEMLRGLDTLIVDLQDTGTRVYTYIWTLYLCMQAAAEQGVKIIVLDRPNPSGGIITEGNLPLPEWYSFVCMEQLPMRHGFTIGEIAGYLRNRMHPRPDVTVIPMSGWKREYFWTDTGLTWVNPSPNLATPDSSLVYPGTVLIEGTRLSEGRGTTRSLELIGHPDLDPFSLAPLLRKELAKNHLHGAVLRPVSFRPTFDKHSHKICGGFQIHPVDPNQCRPWRMMQHLLRLIYHTGAIPDFWNTDPYEYENQGLAIDYINGDPVVREWIEANGSAAELADIEQAKKITFDKNRQQFFLY